jgi:hypothetical protein
VEDARSKLSGSYLVWVFGIMSTFVFFSIMNNEIGIASLCERWSAFLR